MQKLRSATVLCIGALVMLSGLAFAADESNMAAKVDLWETEYNAGNFEALVAMYSADGCRMPPNLEPAYGAEAILENLVTGREAGIASIDVELSEAHTDRGTGWATGTYIIMAEDGTEIDSGKWLNVSKNVDGEWKIHCDIWNSNLPLAAAE